MLQVIQKKILIASLIGSLLLVSIVTKYSLADTPTDTPTPTPTPTGTQGDGSQIQQLQQQISDLQGKISDLQGQEQTLSNAIAVMDDKIQLAQNEIDVTKQKISLLNTQISETGNKINSLNTSLTDLSKLLISRIIATYEQSDTQSLDALLTSQNVGEYLSKANYVKAVQAHDKELVYSTEQAKNDYSNLKAVQEQEKQQIEDLQASLVKQNQELDQEKQAKQSLLAETQGSEANYQHQLAAAKAQLAGFSRFVSSQGGASLLSGQTSCDSWGCYYNQRDSQWGDILINGQSGYTMAGYGCLITSIAMVASHMGHNISPADIATSSGDNFAFDTAMLKYSISVDGVNISRTGVSPLDSALSSGPVIVGIYAYGGTHFVVLKSGSGGNYVMDDPYIENGHDINFTDHYSLGSIFEMDKISM